MTQTAVKDPDHPADGATKPQPVDFGNIDQPEALSKRLQAIRRRLRAIKKQNIHRQMLGAILGLAVVGLLFYVAKSVAVFRLYDEAASKAALTRSEVDLILVSATGQAVLLIAMIGVMFVRGFELSGEDEQEIEGIKEGLKLLQTKMDDLNRQFQNLSEGVDSTHPTVQQIIEGIQAPSTKELIKEIREDLSPSQRRIVEQYASALIRLRELGVKLTAAEVKLRGMQVSTERVVAGYCFGVVPVVSAILLILHGFQELQLLRTYALFATLSSACAGTAFAMLGRGTMDEKRMLSDLLSLTPAVNVLAQLLQVPTTAVAMASPSDARAKE